MRHKKTTIIFLAIALAFVGTGFVAALNGYFGGGDTIPEDTFTRGLVGYWSFDEGTGQIAYDNSDNNNDGTLGGTSSIETSDPVWTTPTSSPSQRGVKGNALNFDGEDDYVDCGSDESVKPNHISISVWLRLRFVPDTSNRIVSKWWDGSSRSYELFINTGSVDTSTLYFYVSTDGNIPDTSCYHSFSAYHGLWTHVVATYDGSIQRLYFNGVEVASNSGESGNINPNNADLIIGAQPRDANPTETFLHYFNGAIDEVRIYNRALSAEEIRYHYNRGCPVASWNFDEGSGSTIYDSSGNQHHGTLHE